MPRYQPSTAAELPESSGTGRKTETPDENSLLVSTARKLLKRFSSNLPSNVGDNHHVPDPGSEYYGRFGDVTWLANKSPQEIISCHHKSLGGSRIIKISENQGDTQKTANIKAYGSVTPADISLITSILQNFAQSYIDAIATIREVHVVNEIGRFLKEDEESGVAWVRGYYVTTRGELILARELLSNERKLGDFLHEVLQERTVFLQQWSGASRSQWRDLAPLQQRLHKSRAYVRPKVGAPFGLYKNRQIIFRDTQIIGGVVFRWKGRGAVFVDNDSSQLEGIYNELREDLQIKRIDGALAEMTILRMVMEKVRNKFLECSHEDTRKLLESSKIGLDDEVSLDIFVKAGKGISIHKALLAGYLLERLRQDQEIYLNAKISYERNQFGRSTHSWIRYIGSDSEVLILDVEFEFIGLLDDYTEVRWSYHRPGEIEGLKRIRPL